MKKIVGFLGSPRKEGYTAGLLNKILSGAKDKGSQTKIYNLDDMKISGCKACFYCKKNDGCGLKDDMQELYKEIKEADTIIIGSPIYMWQMTAQTKTFIDRLFAFFVDGPASSKVKDKECILAFTSGSPIDSFKNYVDYTSNMLSFLGFKIKNIIIGDNTGNIDGVSSEALAKAYTLGQSLI